MNCLTIGIPTRDGMYYNELFRSLSRAVLPLRVKEWEVEILVCINGPEVDLLEVEIKSAISRVPELKIRAIKQRSSLVGKPLAMKRIVEESRGQLILFLDDDVEVQENAIKDALDIFISRPDVKLVGATPRIIRPILGSLWRNFVYDVINIQQIADVFTFSDPFIFGRFMMLRKKDFPDIPNVMLNEDMYMQILFHPNVVKIRSCVFYRGLAYIRNHYRRVFRLMDGRRQAVLYVGKGLVENYFSDPTTKRILDFHKVIRLNSYFLLCFIIYRILRIFTYVLKPFLYKKPQETGWKRTDSRKLTS